MLKEKKRIYSMFVRTKTSPNSPRKSVQVVENERDPKTGKVKQRILRHVGVAFDEIEEKKLRQLALELIAKIELERQEKSPQLQLFDGPTEEEVKNSVENKMRGRKPKKRLEEILPINKVSLDMVKEEARIIDGVHEVAGHLYDFLGFHNLLRTDRYNKILRDLVLCRIAHPKSKHATSKILHRYYDKEHDLDAIYRTMDQVYEHIPDIKTAVFVATSGLIPGKIDLLLFDVTTLYFESIDTDELRKFGYSKDFRFNTTQVVLALASNSDGLPIGYELFEGNKAEVKTLLASIDSWQKLFAIDQVCFIGDRAMFSEDNLAALEARGYQYIVAAKLRNMHELMIQKIQTRDFYQTYETTEDHGLIGEFNYESQDLDAAKNLKPQSQLKYKKLIEQNKNRRIIASYSVARAQCDRKKRETMLDKISRQLSRSNDCKKLVSNGGIKKYVSGTGKTSMYIDEEKVADDELWDGLHGVITNIDHGQPLEILQRYRSLVKIEECFRINKTTLKMRPIYHYKPDRIKAHVAICYMAFAVLRQLEYRTRLVKKVSIDSIIEELCSVQSSIYVHKITRDRYRVPGKFSNEARKIYTALAIHRREDAHAIV
jgi:transposase